MTKLPDCGCRYKYTMDGTTAVKTNNIRKNTGDFTQSGKILITDDREENRSLLSELLQSLGYETFTAANGKEALNMLKEVMPDLLISDVMMPEIDGCDLCHAVKNDPLTKNIPVVLISGIADSEAKVRGLKAGANDFVGKPFDMAELKMRIKNLIQLKAYNDYMEDNKKLLEDEVARQTADLKKYNSLLEEGYKDTINRLTVVSEFKDQETASHIKRVGEYCKCIARELGWSEEQIDIIEHASPLHDIGKVSIPSEILLKQGKLTEPEFQLMKTHSGAGAKILKNSVSKFLKMGYTIALTHHERFDGTGYPKGLKGTEIPIEGRIMALADIYDALRSERPYKKSFSHEKSYNIITEGDGRTEPKHFDPQILDIFKKIHEEFKKIYDENSDARHFKSQEKPKS